MDYVMDDIRNSLIWKNLGVILTPYFLPTFVRKYIAYAKNTWQEDASIDDLRVDIYSLLPGIFTMTASLLMLCGIGAEPDVHLIIRDILGSDALNYSYNVFDILTLTNLVSLYYELKRI